QRVEPCLDERPDHEDQKDRQWHAQAYDEKADAVECPLATRPPTRRVLAPRGGLRRGRNTCHETSIFSMLSSSRTRSVMACSSLVSSSTDLSPLRKEFQIGSCSVF